MIHAKLLVQYNMHPGRSDLSSFPQSPTQVSREMCMRVGAPLSTALAHSESLVFVKKMVVSVGHFYVSVCVSDVCGWIRTHAVCFF